MRLIHIAILMADLNKPTYWNIDRIMRLILGLAITAGLLWLISYLSDALLPFFLACVIAYVLQPLVNLNMKLLHTKKRVLASISAIIEVTAVVVGLLWVTVPSIVEELDRLGKIIVDISTGKIPLPYEYRQVVRYINRNFDPQHFSRIITQMHPEELLRRGSSLLQESTEFVVRTVEWLLTLIYALFILIDFPTIVRGFKLIVPEKYRPKALEIMGDVKKGMNHYFRGQGLVALFAVVFYCVGFSIVRLPLGIPMGIMVGVLYMIPYFQYVTLIPVALICFISSLGGGAAFLPEMGKCLLVYLVSQSICDYIVTPHIMGRELGLNPAIILLSLSVWGSLLGIIGMIIALPVTALLMQYYETYISNRK